MNDECIGPHLDQSVQQGRDVIGAVVAAWWWSRGWPIASGGCYSWGSVSLFSGQRGRVLTAAAQG